MSDIEVNSDTAADTSNGQPESQVSDQNGQPAVVDENSKKTADDSVEDIEARVENSIEPAAELSNGEGKPASLRASAENIADNSADKPASLRASAENVADNSADKPSSLKASAENIAAKPPSLRASAENVADNSADKPSSLKASAENIAAKPPSLRASAENVADDLADKPASLKASAENVAEEAAEKVGDVSADSIKDTPASPPVSAPAEPPVSPSASQSTSPPRSPMRIISLSPTSTESHDNPFLADGELSKKADTIVRHSTISRTQLKVYDPDTTEPEPEPVEEVIAPNTAVSNQSAPAPRPQDVGGVKPNGNVDEPAPVTPQSVEVEVGAANAKQPEAQKAEEVKVEKDKKCECCVVQ